MRRGERIMEEYGVVRLQNIYDVEPQTIRMIHDAIHSNFDACTDLLMARRGVSEAQALGESFAFREFCHRSLGRYDLPLDPGVAPKPLPAVLSEKLFGQSALWRQLMARLLGHDWRVNFSSVLYARPGAEPQNPHMDGGHLFYSTHGWKVQAPMHVCQLMLPMCEMPVRRGPTEFWPRSHLVENAEYAHLMPSIPLTASPGDAIIFDFRVIHRGMPNKSFKWRPMLYQTCSRAWFKDDFNFPTTSLMRHDHKRDSEASLSDDDGTLVDETKPSSHVASNTNHSPKYTPGDPGRAGFVDR